MEYLIGAIVAMAGAFFMSRMVSRSAKVAPVRIKYSQSHVFELLGPYIFALSGSSPRKEMVTQSTKFFDSRHQKILFFKGKAYWIRDNSLYTANVVHGMVDEKSTKTLDIMAMDKVELKDMMFIVEKLNEGQDRNDLGNSWK